MAILASGVIIVLLAGTALLSWYWLVPVMAICAGAVLYVSRRKTPSEYVVAQRIDDRLRLADTLSTAFYFSAAGEIDPGIRDRQRAAAEDAARSVDLKLAVPFTRPRALFPAAALALAAAGIFLVRYAVTGSFDPKSSLFKTAYEAAFKKPAEQAKAANNPGDLMQPSSDPRFQKEQDRNSDFAGDPSAPPDQNQAPQQNQEQADRSKDSSNNAQSPQDGAPQGDPNQSAENQNGQSDQSGKQQQDPSLLDKIKEALNDVMSKMKPNSGESSKSQGQKSDAAPQQSQQGQNSQNQDQSQGENSENANEGQQSNDGQNENAANDPQSSKEQKNGIGNGEGDKANRQAEALKAMGKISQLLGKRAENVSGEVMVEVGSTKQTLKTPLLQKQATHGEAGGEIHRDEVPLMYEQFVQQYFDQIRKTPGPKPAVSPAANAK